MQNNYTFKDLGILYLYNELDPETKLNVKHLMKTRHSFRKELIDLQTLHKELGLLKPQINPDVIDNIMNFSTQISSMKTC